MLRYPTKINTTIPGLDISFGKSSSYLYATILHKESGLAALKFTSSPLPFGMREFAKRVDNSCLKDIRWDVPANQLTDPGLFDLGQRAKRQILA